MTELDVEIAGLLYPVLVEVARARELISFGDLIRRTQKGHPDNAAMQRQVPVGMGRRLATVRVFTKAQGYPDLTCLVVNPGHSVPPDSYFTNPEAEQARVAAFDWTKVDAEFSLQIAHWRKAAEKRPKRKREAAVACMAEYYFKHKASLPRAVQEFREQIIAELMAGEDAEAAFAAIVKDLPPFPSGGTRVAPPPAPAH